MLGEQFSKIEVQDHALRLGMWVFLGSEMLLFSGLFAVYAFYRAMYGVEFTDAIHHNTVFYGTLNTYVLLTSSFTVALSIWAVRSGRPRIAVGLLGVTALQGFVFLGVKTIEYARHVHEGALPGPFYHFAELPTFGANRFFTLYWVMTGLHAAHVTAGLIVILWMARQAYRRVYTPKEHTWLELGTLYWHLVDVIWIFLWPLLYLS